MTSRCWVISGQGGAERKENSVSSAWFCKCFHCSHYSGTETSGRTCLVCGSVMALESPLARQCPQTSCKEGLRAQGCAEMVGAR